MSDNTVYADISLKEPTPAIMMDAIYFEGKDPDTVNYLLLLKISTDEDDAYSWHCKTGRQTTYDYLKELVQNVAVDTDNSYVMSDTATLDKAITLRVFMKNAKDGGMVTDFTDFNVDDYRLDPTEEGHNHSLIDQQDDHGIIDLYAIG